MMCSHFSDSTGRKTADDCQTKINNDDDQIKIETPALILSNSLLSGSQMAAVIDLYKKGLVTELHKTLKLIFGMFFGWFMVILGLLGLV